MSVTELMTAKMNALCIMTNISPYFHLNFLIFDVVIILMIKPKFCCLQRAFSSRRLGFSAMQQMLYIRPQKILLAREKSLSDFQ